MFDRLAVNTMMLVYAVLWEFSQKLTFYEGKESKEKH